MAENINIKLLIDAAESAKTVAETRKALRDLRAAALSVEEGSEAFNKINQAAGQLQDKVADLSASTKFFADDLKNLSGLTNIAEGIAGGFAIAQGAMQSLGLSTQSAEEAQKSLMVTMNILNGLTAVGNVLQKESAATMFLQNTTRSIAIKLTSQQAVAEAAEAVAAGTATIAQRALNAAMNANPVALLVTLILSAVAALTIYSSKTKEAEKQEAALKKQREEAAAARKKEADEIKKYAGYVAAESAELLKNVALLKQTNYNSKERRDLIKDINNTYGTTIKNIQDEKKFQEQLNNVVKEYIEYKRVEYRLKANAKAIEDAFAKQEAARTKILIMNLGLSEEVIDSILRGEKNILDVTNLTGAAATNLIVDVGEQVRIYGEQEKALYRLGIRAGKLEKQFETFNFKGKKGTSDTTKEVKKLEDGIRQLYDYMIDAKLDLNAILLKDIELTFDEEVTLMKEKNGLLLKEEDDKFKQSAEKRKAFLLEELKKDKNFNKLSVDEQERLLNEKLINDKAYIDASVAYTNKTNAIKKQGEQEVTEFIAKETEKRRILTNQLFESIITPQEFRRFYDFIGGDVFKVGIEDFDKSLSEFIKRTATNLKELIDDGLSIDLREKLEKEFMEPFNNIIESIENGTSEITVAISSLNDKPFSDIPQILKDLFTIDSDLILENTTNITSGIEKNAVDLVKMSAIYGDKFNIIYNAELEFGKKITEMDSKQKQTVIDRLNERFNLVVGAEQRVYDEQLYLLFKRYNDGLITEEQFLKESERLNEEHEDNLLAIQVAYGKKGVADLAKRTAEKTNKKKEANKKELDEEKAFQQRLMNEIISLESRFQDLSLSLYNQYLDKRGRLAQQALDDELLRIDAEETKWKNSLEQKTAAEQAQFDIEQGFQEQRKNADDKFRIEQDKINEKRFKAQKANDLATIAIQTAVALARTVAELGGIGAITPPGIALLALIAAGGVAQASIVASQQYVPQFAMGGLVRGPGDGQDDMINAKLSNGESVINAKSTRMFAPILSAINQAGGGVPIPQFGVGTSMVDSGYNSESTDMKDLIDVLGRRTGPVEAIIKHQRIIDGDSKWKRLTKRRTFG